MTLAQVYDMLLRELSDIQKVALANDTGALREIAERLHYLAVSIPDLSRLARAQALDENDTSTKASLT